MQGGERAAALRRMLKCAAWVPPLSCSVHLSSACTHALSQFNGSTRASRPCPSQTQHCNHHSHLTTRALLQRLHQQQQQQAGCSGVELLPTSACAAHTPASSTAPLPRPQTQLQLPRWPPPHLRLPAARHTRAASTHTSTTATPVAHTHLPEHHTAPFLGLQHAARQLSTSAARYAGVLLGKGECSMDAIVLAAAASVQRLLMLDRLTL